MFQNLSIKYSKKGPFSPYFATGFCFDNPILDPSAVRFVYSRILTGLDWLIVPRVDFSKDRGLSSLTVKE